MRVAVGSWDGELELLRTVLLEASGDYEFNGRHRYSVFIGGNGTTFKFWGRWDCFVGLLIILFYEGSYRG